MIAQMRFTTAMKVRVKARGQEMFVETGRAKAVEQKSLVTFILAVIRGESSNKNSKPLISAACVISGVWHG